MYPKYEGFSIEIIFVCQTVSNGSPSHISTLENLVENRNLIMEIKTAGTQRKKKHFEDKSASTYSTPTSRIDVVQSLSTT